MSTLLRPHLLDPTLAQEPPRIIVSRVYAAEINNAIREPRSATPRPAKNIVEAMDLIKDAIEDYERRTGVLEQNKVNLTYEFPSERVTFDTVSLTIHRREPGAFAQGSPFKGDTKNLRPILREEFEDPENPGYHVAVLGYFHDNIVRITPWCLTNKGANARMLWLEELIEQYIWYFRLSGVNRFLYWQHGTQLENTVNNCKIYGRPIDFYVRTETLRKVSEKDLEAIYLNLAPRIDSNL